MINVSNAFLQEMQNGNRNFKEYVDITLADGKELSLTEKDLWSGGIEIDEAVSGDSSFDIGSAIINQCAITINNIYDEFSAYDFLDAKVSVQVGLELPDETIEKIQKGIFFVDETKYNGSIITLTCLDAMSKFDKDYSESTLTYPATLLQIIQDACSKCGVLLGIANFPRSNTVINERPNDESVTFRQVINWVGQISCQWFRIGRDGRLISGWYNQSDYEEISILHGGNFGDETEDSVSGGTFGDGLENVISGGEFDGTRKYHHIYSLFSQNIDTDDVVITGIRVTDYTEDSETDPTTYMSGTDGYVLEISENRLITAGFGNTVASWLGDQLIGLRFRPLSVTFQSNPTVEPGDLAIVSNYKGDSYPTLITRTVFKRGSAQSVVCGAKSAMRNRASRYSEATKYYSQNRNQIHQEKTEREKAVEALQQTLKNSSGMYLTEEKQEDGSTITYLHDKKTLEESQNIIKITAEAVGISNDGGQTYPYGLFLTGDLIARLLYVVGINADYINSGSITIKKGDKVTFFADTETGRVDIKADSFSLTGKTISEIADEQINDFVDVVLDPQISNLQAQIDGQIETWYYDYEPTLNNAPASSWTTEEERKRHEGDLFYWKSKGYSYRFFKDGSTWKWQMVQDTDITKALEQAAEAQDTADGKRRVFTSTPTPPYDIGDLWSQGSGGDLMVCKTVRQSGTFVSTDWQKASKYTDDTAVDDLDTALDQEGVFNRLTNSGASKGIYIENGQLYINASYILSGIFSVSKPGGKQTFYANTETGVVKIVADEFSLTNGDTIDSIAEDYANTAYQSSTQYTDQQLQDYSVNLSQEAVFNALTNNEQLKGIFMKDGQLYINASYILSGTLKLGGASNTNGLLQVYNSSGVLVGTIDKDGAKFTNGSDWLTIAQSLLSGGYGSTTDGILDLSANYSDGRHVVLESKTGDVILKSADDFRVQRQSGGMGYLVQSGGTSYFGSPSVSYGTTYPVIGIMFGRDDTDNAPYLDIRLANGSQATLWGDTGSSSVSGTIVNVQEVTVTCGSVAAGSSASGSASFTRYSAASKYYAVLKSSGWLTPSSVTVGTSSISVTFLNTSSGTHSGTARFLIFAVS